MQLYRRILASELNKRLEWKKVDWKPSEAVRDVELRPPGVWGREYYGRRQYLPTHQCSSWFPSWRFQFWCTADWRFYNFVESSACLFVLENEYKTTKSWNTLKYSLNSLNNQCFHRKSFIALWGRIKIRSKVANFRINFFHWFVPMVQIFGNIWRRIRRSEKRVWKDEKAVKSLRFNKLTILCQIAKSGKNG